MEVPMLMTAKEALAKLKEGNRRFMKEINITGDFSPAIRKRTWLYGQHPYAIIITCSDSRVIPEAIFDANLGDLFVIRLAGNVIDAHQLGSIEYAAGHLGCPLIVVLGHTHCGAVDAAINHDPEGFIKFITDEIRLGIGDATDPLDACVRNVNHSLSMIQHSLEIHHIEEIEGLNVIGAVYHIEDGHVDFLHLRGAEDEDECEYCTTHDHLEA